MIAPTQQPHPARAGRRLGALIAASIAAHWLLLSAWNEGSNPTPAIAPLTVKLLSSPAAMSQQATTSPPASQRTKRTTPPASMAQRPAQKTEQKTAPKMVQVSSDTTPTAPATTTELVAATAAAEKQSAPTIAAHTVVLNETAKQGSDAATPKTRAEVTEMMRTTLSRDINHYFKYPRLASRRNWEGTVLLDIQIENDGRISRVTLAQSSGYALLDNNAIATLTRIGNLSGTTQWLGRGNIELQIPVIYRITDS